MVSSGYPAPRRRPDALVLAWRARPAHSERHELGRRRRWECFSGCLAVAVLLNDAARVVLRRVPRVHSCAAGAAPGRADESAVRQVLRDNIGEGTSELHAGARGATRTAAAKAAS